MDITMVVLRLVHIFSAFLWVGTTFSMVLFIGPTAQAVGADAQKFMQYFTQKSGLSSRLTIAAFLTVGSGLWMYFRLFGGLAPLNSGSGLALTVGGIAGIGALSIGTAMGRRINQMRKISEEIAKAGGPPKPEQGAELGTLSEALTRLGGLNAILMSVALIGMILSEYFAF